MLAAVRHGASELRVLVRREVEKGRACRPLLALEQHRCERRGQEQRGRGLQLRDAHERRQALTGGPVAHLVVGLGRDDERARWQRVRFAAARPAPVARPLAVVHPGLTQRLAELSKRPEVLVVAGVLAREHRVQRVVPVVIPHRVEPIAAGGAVADDPRVVELRLGDDERGSAEPFAQRRDLRRQLLEDVGWRLVDDRVHRIEAQAVQVVVADPHCRVVDSEPAHLSCIGPIEVERSAPRGMVPVAEVGSKPRQEVADRAEVVVDDIQDHGQAGQMARVDKTLHRLGTAIGLVGREQVDAVVTPAARAGELGHRHDLDRIHAELDQVGEALDRGIERSGGGERADVKLVQDEAFKWAAAPAGVAPRMGGLVDDLRQPQHTVGLRE